MNNSLYQPIEVLAEIEAVLSSHEAVEQAVVFTIPHARSGELLAAAAVFYPGKHVSESQLKMFLFQHLPQSKVPLLIVFVDILPYTNAGKIERNGLAEKLSAMIKPGYVPPGTETETRLLPLWCEVLEVETIGRFDNFFVCGGDMVLAEQLAFRICEESRVYVSARHLLLYPAIGEMGCFIDETEPQKNNREFSHLMSEIDDLSDDDLF